MEGGEPLATGRAVATPGPRGDDAQAQPLHHGEEKGAAERSSRLQSKIVFIQMLHSLVPRLFHAWQLTTVHT